MKSVITVMGKDGVGIIARVSALLAENEINIIDISQTTYDNQFLMVMIVDMESSKIPFNEIVHRKEPDRTAERHHGVDHRW